jgi:hypothetical protein
MSLKFKGWILSKLAHRKYNYSTIKMLLLVSVFNFYLKLLSMRFVYKEADKLPAFMKTLLFTESEISLLH